nr:unnamed protein product [Digitaria exilis]
MADLRWQATLEDLRRRGMAAAAAVDAGVRTTHVDVQKSPGLSKAETHEIVFKDYWEEVNAKEHLELVYLEEVRVILNRKFDCNRENLEKFPDEDHKPDANMFAENATIEETIPFDSKGKQNVNTSLKKRKSNKKTYIGWGSRELIEFLSSIGMDTSKALDESEIVGVIMRTQTHIRDPRVCRRCTPKLGLPPVAGTCIGKWSPQMKRTPEPPYTAPRRMCTKRWHKDRMERQRIDRSSVGRQHHPHQVYRVPV